MPEPHQFELAKFAWAFMSQWLVPASLASVVSWYFNKVIAERAKRAIGHEYDEKLKTHEAKLNEKLQDVRLDHDAKLQSLKIEHERSQKKTEMFFDHQRLAFQEILSHISLSLRHWDSLWDQHREELGSCPSERRMELEDLIVRHALFLDDQCRSGMTLVVQRMRDSLPFEDEYGVISRRDPELCYSDVAYILPRLARVFQQKLGVTEDMEAQKEIGLIGLARYIRMRKVKLDPNSSMSRLGYDELNPNSYVLPLLEEIPYVRDWLSAHVAHLRENMVRNQRALRELQDYFVLLGHD